MGTINLTGMKKNIIETTIIHTNLRKPNMNDFNVGANSRSQSDGSTSRFCKPLICTMEQAVATTSLRKVTSPNASAYSSPFLRSSSFKASFHTSTRILASSWAHSSHLLNQSCLLCTTDRKTRAGLHNGVLARKQPAPA